MYDKDKFNKKPRWEENRQHDYNRDKKTFRPQQHQSFQKQRFEEKPAEPSPLNGMCNQLCALFWCTKRSYQIRREPSTGRKYVFCTWIGDECIGASCQYASCKNNYLLPDGSCAWLKQKKIEEDAEEEEFLAKDSLDEKTKNIVAKKLGKKITDDLL